MLTQDLLNPEFGKDGWVSVRRLQEPFWEHITPRYPSVHCAVVSWHRGSPGPGAA